MRRGKATSRMSLIRSPPLTTALLAEAVSEMRGFFTVVLTAPVRMSSCSVNMFAVVYLLR
jgi:hypothetical protein